MRNEYHDYAAESQHIYGKALDFDMGVDDSTNSRRNFEVYKAGRTAGATFWLLYDQNKKEIKTKPYPEWPGLPTGVTKYTKGHLDWR